MRKCVKCKIIKSLDQFWKIRKNKESYRSYCIQCLTNEKKNLKYQNPTAYRKRLEYYKKRYRVLNGLDENTPRLRARPGEGKFKDKKGYVILRKKDCPFTRAKSGNIPEHIYVMCTYLKRSLHEGETVHHKNGIRDDNRIENLELWNNKHPSGQRVEDKINWCIEFLTQYLYEVKKCLIQP